MSDLELQTRLSEKPSPIRRLRVNAAPTLTALFDAPAHMLNAISIDEVESRARRVKSDENLRSRSIAAYVAAREPYPLSPHIEERIYSGFPGPNDEARMVAFHEATWPNRFAIAQSFEDERLRWFGLRLIYFEARSVLPPSARAEIEGRLAGQLTGDGTGALTCEQAMAETDKLLEEVADTDGLLSQYRLYLRERSARVAASGGASGHLICPEGTDLLTIAGTTVHE